ncbi:MAG: phosphopyruvate hydratase [Patescibacteria group bacterium]
MKIQMITGRSILDSRANWTLEVEVLCEGGVIGRAAVPSGAVAGAHEGKKLGIETAIGNVQAIMPSLVGQDVTGQQAIDQKMIELDGTPEKSTLGANVLYAISMAVADAAAKVQNIALYHWIQQLSGTEKPTIPTPLFNLINGGSHANNNLPFQEFCIVPKPGLPIAEQIGIGRAVMESLKELLHARGLGTAVGDEGGYAPWLHRNEEALDLLLEAIKQAGHQPGVDVTLAIDVAASNIPDLHASTYPLEPATYYQQLIQKYSISILEDPLDQEDWAGWTALTAQLGGSVAVIGDDLFNTNATRLQRGIAEKAANAILIKPDDVGTLTEVLQTVQLAKQSNYGIVVSHRAGETESTMIADLAVGIGASYMKAGGLSRSERTAKYNQLLRLDALLTETGIKNWS